jgi:molybdopterin molybdotransferase
VLARAGRRLGPEQILALAGVGWARVLVRRRPKIAILSTGAELVPFTQKDLPLGLIRNSTAPFLIAALEEMGFRADYLGIQRRRCNGLPPID